MKSRLLARVLVTVLAAGSVQIAAAATQTAQAAPVSCSTSAKVFRQDYNGVLWYYEHLAPSTGDYSWAGGQAIGTGFDGTTLASGDGWIYFVNRAGELRLYRYDGQKWDNASGRLIGTGWTRYADYRDKMTIDSAGRIFVIDDYGNLRMYRYDVAADRWASAAGQVVDVGWSIFGNVTAAGDNVLYSRESDGRLLRYRYDATSQRWTDYARVVGNGFSTLNDMFSAGGDTLYLIGEDPADLYWYRYDADSGTWANGGIAKVVGNGWYAQRVVSTISSACTVPPPPPMPPASPSGFRPDLPIGGDGSAFTYFEVGAGGHAYALSDNGNGLTRTQLGDAVFATDLSSAALRHDRMLAGIDSVGTVKIFDWRTNGPWRSLGGSMVRVEIASSPVADTPVNLVGTDSSGQMWWRRENQVGGDWTSWQPVTGLSRGAAAGLGGKVYGVGSKPGDVNGSASGWFIYDNAAKLSGTIPAAASFTTPSPAEVWAAAPVLFAKNRTDGNVYALFGGQNTGFDPAWTALPALNPAQPSVKVGSYTIKAVEASNAAVVVTAVGTDGGVYVTSQTARDSKQFHAWQRLGQAQAVTSASVVGHAPGQTNVAFKGTDGLLYRYTATPSLGDYAPLVFTGGGRG